MRLTRTIFLTIGLLIYSATLQSQSKPFVSKSGELIDSNFAEWINMPKTPELDYGVYYFRKEINLQSVPLTFVVNVSADNRYRLYVNGQMVLWGPAVGDLNNWKYETLDIAKYLQKGSNILAAQVWNMGPYRGARQITNKTAFILQGETSNEAIVNTNKTWKVTKDFGYFPISFPFAQFSKIVGGGGYIAGATDSIDGNKHCWGWERPIFDDSGWVYANEIGKGNHLGLNTWKGTRWMLQPRKIPFMEQKMEPIQKILELQGIPNLTDFNNGLMNVTIPSNSHVEILLDNCELTMGFPQLITQGGKNTCIKVQYQESMFYENGAKRNRNEWKGKIMKGYYDVFITDGGANRLFQPLWLRVFRYVKLTITTQDTPLIIKEFNNQFTAYPFEQKVSFSSNNPILNDIWKTSWRTARLCALETYMDCPYYEQLQYIGDTRIQALISYFVANDDRLAKNAIEQIYGSFQPMGLTKSNHPGYSNQIIPPFSLLFINMAYDYFMYRSDTEFIKQYIPGFRFILDYFINEIDETGMLGPIPYWNYVDASVAEFNNGTPPGSVDGHSAHLSLLLAYTIDNAIKIFNYYGYNYDSIYFQKISKNLKLNVLNHCFDANNGLIAETSDKNLFSQHTNSLAILSGTLTDEVAIKAGMKLVNDSTLIKTGSYFSFYTFQALKKVGLGDQLPNELNKWKSFLDYGLTTFPEHKIESRSDCHAWAAHPMFDLLNITCGFESGSPGFKDIIIAPQVGYLKEFTGKLPHPLGEVVLNYSMAKNGSKVFDIQLPKGLKGVFVFNNKSYALEGKKRINIK